jgi:hypothetical protein
MMDTLTRDVLKQGMDLLQPGELTDLPGSGVPFVTQELFTTNNPEAQFSTIWEEFRKRFFGVIDEAPPAVSLRNYKLRKISPDGPIIEALGGESAVETHIASVYDMIKRQAHGRPGPLQINGYANVFYVKDKTDALCAVRVAWDGEGWIVDAIPVCDPLAWNGQHQIFCPSR